MSSQPSPAPRLWPIFPAHIRPSRRIPTNRYRRLAIHFCTLQLETGLECGLSVMTPGSYSSPGPTAAVFSRSFQRWTASSWSSAAAGTEGLTCEEGLSVDGAATGRAGFETNGGEVPNLSPRIHLVLQAGSVLAARGHDLALNLTAAVTCRTTENKGPPAPRAAKPRAHAMSDQLARRAREATQSLIDGAVKRSDRAQSQSRLELHSSGGT
ncbi:hypothetical protein PENSPDRAFT_740655 [Peniophora sp. CONT]|nr:hypothetical protein PENSPDRAFT_740655 [Peniophora sp. CONT]